MVASFNQRVGQLTPIVVLYLASIRQGVMLVAADLDALGNDVLRASCKYSGIFRFFFWPLWVVLTYCIMASSERLLFGTLKISADCVVAWPDALGRLLRLKKMFM